MRFTKLEIFFLIFSKKIIEIFFGITEMLYICNVNVTQT